MTLTVHLKLQLKFYFPSYNKSFFKKEKIGIATARAGNVIGGGDWNKDRLVPDAIKSIIKKRIDYPSRFSKTLQHVFEPLSGYIKLSYFLYNNKSNKFNEPWNFGPNLEKKVTVLNLINSIFKYLDIRKKLS